MFGSEHSTFPVVPRRDSFNGLIPVFGGWVCVSCQPVHGREQLQTVRRLKSLNETAQALHALVFWRMARQKRLGLLCGAFQQFDFNVLLLGISVAGGVIDRTRTRLKT